MTLRMGLMKPYEVACFCLRLQWLYACWSL
jgi:hypothetical protein